MIAHTKFVQALFMLIIGIIRIKLGVTPVVIPAVEPIVEPVASVNANIKALQTLCNYVILTNIKYKYVS